MQAGIMRLGQALLSYEDKISVVANNLANANTPGFKADSLSAFSFDDALSMQIENSDNRDNLNTMYFAMQNHIDMSQGNLVKTDRSSDIALSGSGFLVVDTPQGQYYSRGGMLFVNDEGALVNAAGDYVLGQNGRIKVGAGEFQIAGNGLVLSGGNIVGRLRLVDFADYTTLSKADNGYLQGGGAQKGASATVMQGYIEQSNVDITQEYLSMMSLNRNYQTTQTVIQILDQIHGSEASEIARL